MEEYRVALRASRFEETGTFAGITWRELRKEEPKDRLHTWRIRHLEDSDTVVRREKWRKKIMTSNQRQFLILD
jgi:hypothetical protein